MTVNRLAFAQAPLPDALPVRVVFGETEATTGPPANSTVSLVARVTRLRGTVTVQYESDTSRPIQGMVSSSWQGARRLHRDFTSTWQSAAHLGVQRHSGWQAGQSLHSRLSGAWADADRTARVGVAALFQQAAPVGPWPLVTGWQEAARLYEALASRYQTAQRVGSGPVASVFQQALRDRRTWVGVAYQEAAGLQRGFAEMATDGDPLHVDLLSRYQEARRAAIGRWVRPVVPPPPDPCYEPALPVRLVFSEPGTDSTRLVFVCERHGSGPGPERPRFVIPLLRVYMTVHSIRAVLLPSLERVQLSGVSISSNDDGFGWSLSATGPEHLIDQLAPVGGLPARIRVTIDGIDWVFVVDPPDRTRKFAERKVSVVGQSATALLGAPYMPSSDWANPGGAFTAQQLVAKALEFTGVDIDWGITDWLVPAGAWSFQGTPLAVAQRVAEAVGAVVRSHRTDETLQFAPRYPAMPWEWDAAPLDVQMPGQIMTSDSLQNRRNPDWEAVYVLGQTHGKKGHVVRTGTAGAVLAPQVIDSLITHPDAARQRGQAVLGAAGRGYTQNMTVPLLTGGSNPGLILPGYLLQVDEPGESWRGLVRGITINESAPTVRQQLVVERRA